jgi:hypothetical protein
MYSNVPQEKQAPLFGLTGMNIASCFQNEQGEWYFSSRELMYYTDLETNEPLTEWLNPWTNETVTVMHVANAPVQGDFGQPDDTMDIELLAGGTIIAQPSDVNLFYPNPLANNDTFAPYSPQTTYEGGEFFKFFITAEDLAKDTPTIEHLWFSWERTSQWLPWMRMGNHPGTLFCSTTGSRAEFADLPHFIQTDIRERLPLYAQAPGCLEAVPDSTSWTYFRDHFDAYLAKEQFPVAAPNVSVPCQWAPAHRGEPN